MPCLLELRTHLEVWKLFFTSHFGAASSVEKKSFQLFTLSSFVGRAAKVAVSKLDISRMQSKNFVLPSLCQSASLLFRSTRTAEKEKKLGRKN